MKKVFLGLVIISTLIMSATIAKGEGNMIAEGKKVKIEYVLTVEGNVVDKSEGRGPLEYTQGSSMIIPGLEKELEGLKVGDKKSVTVVAKEAYGEIDPEAIVEIPKTSLPKDQEPKPGMMLQMQSPDGRPVQGVVSGVKEEVVVIDFNHPLAGKELKFDVEIVGVE